MGDLGELFVLKVFVSGLYVHAQHLVLCEGRPFNVLPAADHVLGHFKGEVPLRLAEGPVLSNGVETQDVLAFLCGISGLLDVLQFERLLLVHLSSGLLLLPLFLHLLLVLLLHLLLRVLLLGGREVVLKGFVEGGLVEAGVVLQRDGQVRAQAWDLEKFQFRLLHYIRHKPVGPSLLRFCLLPGLPFFLCSFSCPFLVLPFCRRRVALVLGWLQHSVSHRALCVHPLPDHESVVLTRGHVADDGGGSFVDVSFVIGLFGDGLLLLFDLSNIHSCGVYKCSPISSLA